MPLSSLAWRLFKHPSSLWASILLTTYTKSTMTSFIRKNIQKGWTYRQMGSKWIIETGNHINFWNDHWIDNNTSLRSLIHDPLPLLEYQRPVSSYINNTRWNLDSIPFDLPRELLLKIVAFTCSNP